MHRLNEKRHQWRESIKHRPVMFVLYKSAVITAGIIVLMAGVVMLVTPGPGLLGILAGLSILATEMPWARYLVRRIRLQAKRVFASYRRYKDSR